jgi:signal transduction histidine kinase
MLTQYFVDGLFEQDAINDFVRDTDYIYNELKKQVENDPSINYQNLNSNFPFADEFIISWRPFKPAFLPCIDCEFLGEADGINVYQLESDRLRVIYHFPKINALLFISDKIEPQLFSPENDSDIDEIAGLNVEEIAFYLFTIIVLLVIAGTIYWPVRQLQKQINALVDVNHLFGAGELNVRAQEQLTKPLNELAYSFNVMANSIADTVKENQIFAQAVPHEVRTPLSRIQLAVGLLRKKNTNKQAMQLLENIDTYIDDIDELISQVVSFSKLNSVIDENGADLYQRINFSAFIKSRLNAVKLDELINIQTSLDESLEITTNPIYLRLLIDNLLKNAINHARSQIMVSLCMINDKVKISIEDDGPGIPAQFTETIFFPFARLDKSRSRKTGGLGLGLSIAKAASKRMNSVLSVENNQNGGSKFSCKFH